MSDLPDPARPEASGAGEMVVVVRDIGSIGPARMAEVIRESGCHAGFVTGPELGGATVPDDHVTATVKVDDPTDPEEVARAVARLSDGYRLSAVVASSDACIPAAAGAAERLGAGRTPAAPILQARNKFTARQVLRGHGLPVPGYALLHTADEAAAAAAAVGLPAVVKPVSGTGSHLITTVHSAAELAAAYERSVARLPAGQLGNLYRRRLDMDVHGQVDPSRTLLVEHALAGPEYCVDLVVQDGRVQPLPLIDKALLDDQFFELAFVSPPFDLAPEREDAIATAAADAVSALGLDNTVAHVEVIDDATLGPTIVEVNAGRPGGAGPALLYRMRDVDTIAALVATHRGTPFPLPAGTGSVPLASLCVYAHGSGRLAAVHGLDEVAEHPDVVSVTQMAEPGDPLTDDREVMVAVAVVAGFLDLEDLRKMHEELAGAIRLERR